jgi:signal recognition particle GTPase
MAIQGKPLQLELKRTMVVLKSYFDRIKDDPKEISSSSVQRVANALDVGIATVKRVMAEFNRNHDFFERDELS